MARQKIADMALCAEMVVRLVTGYLKSKPEQRKQGHTWYYNANRVADDMSHTTGHTIEVCAGVLAALSPQKSWKENKTIAWRALTTGTATGHVRVACDKANQIMRYGCPEQHLGTLKTANFYADIVCAGEHPTSCTIDRWALRALTGDPTADTVKPAGYHYYRRHYVAAARYLRVLGYKTVTPAKLQATLWVAMRGTGE